MLWAASAERHPLKESLCSQRAKGSFPDGELNESSQKVRMVTEPLRKHWGRGRLGAPYSPFKSCYANKYILGIVEKPQSGQFFLSYCSDMLNIPKAGALASCSNCIQWTRRAPALGLSSVTGANHSSQVAETELVLKVCLFVYSLNKDPHQFSLCEDSSSRGAHKNRQEVTTTTNQSGWKYSAKFLK